MLRSFTTLQNSEIDSIAIGGFDGVHKAHKELISHLSTNGVVLVIDRGGKGLTPGKSRCEYMDRGCIIISLDEIKDKSPKKFVEFLTKTFPNLKKIIVGYDFRFGSGREGSTKDLREMFDGDVVVVDEVKEGAVSIHSKTIKALLKEGDIKKADELLGRHYKIEGEVIKGQGLGKKELYPTINIDPKEYILPKDGVYATFVTVNGKKYRSVTFIGKRESVDGNFSVETHIIDSFDDFVGDSVKIEFVKFLRENRKFATLSELREAIGKDIDDAKISLSTL